MPKDISELQSRVLTEEETRSVAPKTKKAIIVEELAKRFIDPKTREHIKVGQGIEIGWWDTDNEALNWIRYYLPDAKKDHLKWGKQKTKGDHALPTTSIEVRKHLVEIPGEKGDAPQQVEKVFLWVMRIRE